MRVFGLLTPYYGVLKPLVYWPYQSVRLHNVMTEHICIKIDEYNKNYVLFIKRQLCKQNDTNSVISKRWDYLICPPPGASCGTLSKTGT